MLKFDKSEINPLPMRDSGGSFFDISSHFLFDSGSFLFDNHFTYDLIGYSNLLMAL